MSQPGVQPLHSGKEPSASPSVPLATLFAVPKPFIDPQISLIQSNAIRSWLLLAPRIEVVLCGDDPGVAEFAQLHAIRHLPQLLRNQHGTPLVNDAFDQVLAHSDSRCLVYCNADVILLQDLVATLERLGNDGRFDRFLAFGRRSELDIRQPVDLGSDSAVQQLLSDNRRLGKRGPLICKEYFLMTRDAAAGMPKLAVGRGNWDNWMVAQARRNGCPVVDVSHCVTAIHQRHDYRHTGRSRLNCYLTGVEARENQQQAGGTHWVRGSAAEWTMDDREIRRNGWSWISPQFWADLPAFLRLAVQLPFQR